jgi:hypothetical protein
MKVIVVVVMMEMMMLTLLVTQTSNQRLVFSCGILKHFAGHLVTGVCSAKHRQTVFCVRGAAVLSRSR